MRFPLPRVQPWTTELFLYMTKPWVWSYVEKCPTRTINFCLLLLEIFNDSVHRLSHFLLHKQKKYLVCAKQLWHYCPLMLHPPLSVKMKLTNSRSVYLVTTTTTTKKEPPQIKNKLTQDHDYMVRSANDIYFKHFIHFKLSLDYSTVIAKFSGMMTPYTPVITPQSSAC